MKKYVKTPQESFVPINYERTSCWSHQLLVAALLTRACCAVKAAHGGMGRSSTTSILSALRGCSPLWERPGCPFTAQCQHWRGPAARQMLPDFWAQALRMDLWSSAPASCSFLSPCSAVENCVSFLFLPSLQRQPPQLWSDCGWKQQPRLH